jgi:hypothetical protein
LMGVGIVPQLNGLSSKPLTYIALSGFIFSAIGTFLGHLFAADASALKGVQQDVQATNAKVDAAAAAIVTGNTDFLKKTVPAVLPDPPKTP